MSSKQHKLRNLTYWCPESFPVLEAGWDCACFNAAAQKRTPAAQRVARHCADRAVVKKQKVKPIWCLRNTRPPSRLSQLSSLPHNIAEVTGERKEMRSVNRARTSRKNLIALMCVCVCVCVCVWVSELKEQPCLTNSDKPHTAELLRALRRLHTHRLFAGVGFDSGRGIFHKYRHYRWRLSVWFWTLHKEDVCT